MMSNQPWRKRQRSESYSQDAAQSESDIEDLNIRLGRDQAHDEDETEDQESQQVTEAKKSTTTRGGPAASSVKSWVQYRNILTSAVTLITNKVNRSIPKFLEIELRCMGFEVEIGGIVNVPLSEYALIEKEDPSRKLLASMDKADRYLTPESDEKDWVQFVATGVIFPVVTDRRWDSECIPFARDQTPDFPQKSSRPQPDIQYHHSLGQVAEIVETLATVDQNPALEACKSCLKRLGTDMWTTLIGTLDEPTATPYVNVGIRPMMIPFFYVRFGVDDRYEVAYNELVTDLLHALYKLRKLREYLQQLTPEEAIGLKLEAKGRSVFGMIATPQVWKLYVAWDQDDDFVIMPIAGNTLPDGLGRLHWVACIRKVFRWADDGKNGWQMAKWLLHIKKQDLAEKAKLGRGEKWTLADLKRRGSPEPDQRTRAIDQWAASTSMMRSLAEIKVEETARVSGLS